jgi:benzoyl-CoA reductase subunit C
MPHIAPGVFAAIFVSPLYRGSWMPITKLIDSLRPALGDPSLPTVTAWKQAHPGGKAVGCFPVYAPVELIHAAGMLPVTVAGAAGQVKLCQADGFLQAFICMIGRSTLELELGGFLSSIDGMLFPSICEVSRGLSGVWTRLGTSKPAFYVRFPQNLDSAHAVDYLTHELGRLRSALEQVAGTEITDEALIESFRVYNQRAQRLAELDRLRAARPERLAGSEFYILRLAGMAIPPEEHTALLTRALEAAQSTPGRPQPRLRMTLMGTFCERPPLGMLEVIEEAGVAIVADDILLGQRWWSVPLPQSGDPFRALAEHYVAHSAICPVVHRSTRELRESVRRRTVEPSADGVIIANAKFCHPALYESTRVLRGCEKAGFPYLKMEFEEDMRTFEPMRTQVEALIEARERLPFAGTENGRERWQDL